MPKTIRDEFHPELFFLDGCIDVFNYMKLISKKYGNENLKSMVIEN